MSVYDTPPAGKKLNPDWDLLSQLKDYVESEIRRINLGDPSQGVSTSPPSLFFSPPASGPMSQSYYDDHPAEAYSVNINRPDVWKSSLADTKAAEVKTAVESLQGVFMALPGDIQKKMDQVGQWVDDPDANSSTPEG